MASGETKVSLTTGPVVPLRMDTAAESTSSGTQLSERGKLARMLHDDIAQVLSGAGLQLDILRMDLAEAVPGIASRTNEIRKLLDHVVKRVRDLSYELNPLLVERGTPVGRWMATTRA
jgi:signal transduction histidine kinase